MFITKHPAPDMSFKPGAKAYMDLLSFCLSKANKHKLIIDEEFPYYFSAFSTNKHY
jgi:hypothetical protein